MFTQGQRIRCVDDHGLTAFENPPVHGWIYTVRAADKHRQMVQVMDDKGVPIRGFFHITRFRGLDNETPGPPNLIGAEQEVPAFDGVTYEPDLDHARLAKQWERVRDFMMDGDAHTLQEIAAATGYPESSVSARLRDLRKEKFGGHTVKRERLEKGGTFYYILVPNML